MVVQKRLSDGIMRQELHDLYYPASRRALQAQRTLLFGSVRFATFVSICLADTESAPTNKFLSKTTIVTFPMAGTYIEAFSLTSGPKFWEHMAG